MPFEIKNIYGIQDEKTKGDRRASRSLEALIGIEEEGEGKECLICLSEERNMIIMPCGHLCVCQGCGDTIQSKNYDCPICRGHIGSLIPFSTPKKV